MRRYFAIFLFGTVLAGDLCAQTAPTETLDDIEKYLNQNDVSRHQSLVQDTGKIADQLAQLAASPVNLLNAYKEAYTFVSFGGAKREHNQVKDWEEKNKALFKEEAFQTALRLHVQYLLATLDKKSGDDEKALNDTLQWLESVPKTPPDKYLDLVKMDLMRQSVANSVFLRAGNQTALAQHLNNWYLGDLTNLPEIHRVNVIGWLRSKKDPGIFEQWKNNMALEQEMSDMENLEAKKEYFRNNRKAWLYWQEGKDYWFYGRYMEALGILRTAQVECPKCEDYDQISGDMRKVIDDARKAGLH